MTPNNTPSADAFVRWAESVLPAKAIALDRRRLEIEAAARAELAGDADASSKAIMQRLDAACKARFG